jgi:hypothetical protein
VVYDVNVSVDADVAEEYAAWLRPHIGKMVREFGFSRAELFSRRAADEGGGGEGKVLFTVAYRAPSRAALDAYLERHAAAMRADGVARFPGKFTATRRVLSLVERFGAAA